MSVWTSKHAIMRDLSKAQGRLVPVDMNSSVGVAVAANEKPPQLATEETEEEFYDKFACGDFDYSSTPDFSLIQQMLEMVRDGNSESSECSIDGGMIQISKVNALSEITKQNQIENKKAIVKLTKSVKKPTDAKVKVTEAAKQKPVACNGPVKKKRQRNVAVSSLLASLESKEINNNSEPLKLLKPTDFISTKAVTESVKKVDEWFTNKENTSVQKNFPKLSSVMFKKKKSVSEKSDKQAEGENKSQTSPTKNTAVFKPSSMADEYYKKYLEKSQLRNSIREDIWGKAERLMKEADAKRAAKAAQMLEETDPILEQVLQQSLENADVVATDDEPTAKSDVKWILTEPRHTGTTDDCIVCTAVQKHGYQIDDVAIEKEVPTPNTSYFTADHELD